MGVILIAYERESEQMALEQLLTARGHQVVRAGNGLTALDAARREPPNLIVSDIVLPRMDGFALCRKWKQDDQLQAVPFFFYTRRHDDPKYERFALELGAERFFARTVQPDALLHAIDELVPRLPRTSETSPLPALDEAAVRRAEEHERLQHAQRLSLERAQQAQNALHAQMADLEATNVRLAAGEARFRYVFEMNPLPMWIADRATGGFIAVNNAALTLYGYGRAEFLASTGKTLLRAGAAANRGGDVGVVAHQSKSGASLDLSLASREIEFDGRSAELICVYDLGDRLVREQQLLEQSATQSAIINGMADGCYVLDTDGRILEVNDAYCRMSGRTRESLRRMIAAELEDGEPAVARSRELPNGHGSDARYEARHKRRDGSTFDVEVSVGKLQHAVADVVVVIRDVTQRQSKLAAQRVSASQMEFLIDLYKHADAQDEAAVIRRLVDHAVGVTHSPLACFFAVGTQDKTLRLSAWRDRHQAQATTLAIDARQAPGTDLFAECVHGRQPVTSNDPALKPQPNGLPDLQRYMAMPLIAADETIAVLAVANRVTDYDDEDRRLLAVMAEGVARLLQSRRTHAQTLSSLLRADIAMQAMIDSMLRVSEIHSPHTAGSARRVAALAVALGREVGLDGERQHSLRVAALLHDIGNVTVPAAILAKPTALSEQEMALVRTHVEAGCALLSGIDFGAPVTDIVMEHHERHNGSGYPQRLKGEDILIEARILAIADAVTAMCSARPHRAALGLDAAIDEINRCAGTQFDAQLVAACTRLVREHGFSLPSV